MGDFCTNRNAGVVQSTCTLSVFWVTAGTSNADTFTVALPIEASAIGEWLIQFNLPGLIDGGAGPGSGAGSGSVSGGATVATLSNASGVTSWATSGSKNDSFSVVYPI